MKQIIIYTADPCPYCMRAKDLLKRKGVEFQEKKLSWDDESAWKELELQSGMKTVPQIYVDGQCIGGYSDIAALDQAGRLDSLIK